MMDELQEREERLNSQNIGDTPPESDATDSLLNGSGYTIGQSERSEDLIPSVIRWVQEREDDDTIKVSKSY